MCVCMCVFACVCVWVCVCCSCECICVRMFRVITSAAIGRVLLAASLMSQEEGSDGSI